MSRCLHQHQAPGTRAFWKGHGRMSRHRWATNHAIRSGGNERSAARRFNLEDRGYYDDPTHIQTRRQAAVYGASIAANSLVQMELTVATCTKHGGPIPGARLVYRQSVPTSWGHRRSGMRLESRLCESAQPEQRRRVPQNFGIWSAPSRITGGSFVRCRRRERLAITPLSAQDRSRWSPDRQVHVVQGQVGAAERQDSALSPPMATLNAEFRHGPGAAGGTHPWHPFGGITDFRDLGGPPPAGWRSTMGGGTRDRIRWAGSPRDRWQR